LSREDQAQVTVHIDFPGLGDLGVWENRTNASAGADSTKHREGGMGGLRSYGGPQTQDNVQVARRYDIVRDHAVISALRAARGRAQMTIVEQPLDEYGVAFGEPVTYSGKLLEVNPGDVNANSNDIRMIELTQDTDNAS
jgi:hypothetical protein